MPNNPQNPTEAGDAYSSPFSEQLNKEAALEEKYGTIPQQAIAAGEGVAKGVAGPLATAAERALGVPGEDIEARAEANPVTHYSAEALGLIGPAALTGGLSAEARAGLEAPEAISTAAKLAKFTQAGAISKAGKATAGALGLEGAAGTAAALGVENALFQAGDEVSKAITGNPNSIQTAAMDVGLSGLLGAGAGYGLGKVSELWKAKFGPEADGFVKDFRDRLNAHANETLPTADAIHAELAAEHNNVSAIKEGLYEGAGLKAKDIEQLLPEKLSAPMTEQAGEVLQAAAALRKRAQAEPGIYQGARLQALDDYGARLAAAMADPTLTPSKAFTALDDFKRGIGTLKNWTPAVSAEAEKPAAGLIGTLYQDVRTGLEDPSVWGKAGSRQKAINEAISSHLTAEKDFLRTFTERVGGESQVSPGKVNTLVNGWGKPNAEIRMEKLGNYLDANDKLYSELEKIHSNLGIENPYARGSLANSRALLSDITPGMRAADFVRSHALNAVAEGSAQAAGGLLGHLSGIPGAGFLGAAFGHYAIKPFMRTMMPSVIGPMLKVGASGEGLHAALQGVSAIAKGDALATRAAKAVFEAGTSVLSSDSSRVERLKKQLDVVNDSPDKLLESGGMLGHYLPGHASAMAETTQNAVAYLQAQKPQELQAGPLDAKISPSRAREAAYSRTAEIAEQPLIVLDRLKNGTLQPKDVQDLQALYPYLYPQLIQKVTDSMVSHLAKEGDVPYKIRRGLTLLMGRPMDSSFTPQAIQAAQATYPLPPAPQPPQSKQSSRPKTAKLGESAKMARTPAEARQQDLRGS